MKDWRDMSAWMGLSLMGHGLVVLWLVHDRPAVLPQPTAPLNVTLIEHTPPQAQTKPTPKVQPSADTEPTIAAEGAVDVAEHDRTPPPGPDPADSVAEQVQATNQATNQAKNQARLITRLHRQVPEVVEGLHSPESAQSAPGYQAHSIPKLPGAPSDFDAWLKPATPQLDQWVNSGGGMGTRQVLSDGTVLCSRVRAPTTQEVFNPWMSAAVPMTRVCGRDKAPMPDLSNPWLRARPTALESQ
ncbi:MAG: hypothetical protein RI542_00655 [Wenzhouxiangella sp.]|nr:hypothetical protein [Wenzhouxiangella sp.]